VQTERRSVQFRFPGFAGGTVVAHFDGGPLSTDAGGLLLSREVGKHTALRRQFVQCFVKCRTPKVTEHRVAEMVAQRGFVPPRGYEDRGDHELRRTRTVWVQ